MSGRDENVDGSRMISFACSCGKRYRVKSEHAGRKTKCPSCGAMMTVPGVASAIDRTISTLQQGDSSAVSKSSSVPLVGNNPTNQATTPADLAPSFCHYAYTSPMPIAASVEKLQGYTRKEQWATQGGSTGTVAAGKRTRVVVNYRCALAKSDAKSGDGYWYLSSPSDVNAMGWGLRRAYAAAKKRVYKRMGPDKTILGEVFSKKRHLVFTPDRLICSMNNRVVPVIEYSRFRGVTVQSRTLLDTVILFYARRKEDNGWLFNWMSKWARPSPKSPYNPETLWRVNRFILECPKSVSRHIAQLLADLTLAHASSEHTVFAGSAGNLAARIPDCCIGCMRPAEETILFQDINRPTAVGVLGWSFLTGVVTHLILGGGLFAVFAPGKKVTNVFSFPICRECASENEPVRRVITMNGLLSFSFKNSTYAAKWLEQADDAGRGAPNTPEQSGEVRTSINDYLKSKLPTNEIVGWFVGADIPEKRRNGALGKYAKIQADEQILALKDASVVGSGKSGFLITSRGLYYKELSRKGFLSWRGIVRVEVAPGFLNAINGKINVRVRSGKTVEVQLSGFPPKAQLTEMLNHLVVVYGDT